MELYVLHNFFNTVGWVYHSVQVCVHCISTSVIVIVHSGGVKLSDDLVNDSDSDKILIANFTVLSCHCHKGL